MWLSNDDCIKQVHSQAIEFKTKKSPHEFIVFPLIKEQDNIHSLKSIKEELTASSDNTEPLEKGNYKRKEWKSTIIAPWDKLDDTTGKREVREVPCKKPPQDVDDYWTRSREDENDQDIGWTIFRTSEQSVLTMMLPLKKWAKKQKLPDWGREPLDEIELTNEPPKAHKIMSPMTRHVDKMK